MTTFEVTIETAESKGLKLLVAAEHWVDAWTESLAVMGDPLSPPDAGCVIDGATARIEVPTTRRVFVVRPLGWEPLTSGRPEPGMPLLLTTADPAGPSIRVLASRGPAEAVTGEPASRALGSTAPPTTGKRPRPIDLTVVDRPTLPAGDDPVARVLSDLERQRLGARPLRFDAQGLPEPFDATSRRRATPQAVPRALKPGDERRLRTREDTLAFVPPVASASASESLPQQFRPVVGAEGQAPMGRLGALQWAVDTAWSHVPCTLALVLGGLDREAPEVLLARGERERETRGCRVPLELAFRQVTCRAPTRVRFADRAVIHFIGADGPGFDVEVASTLCAPVAFVQGHESAQTQGLGLVLLNSTRASGFTDSELRALTYLARTLAEQLEGQ